MWRSLGKVGKQRLMDWRDVSYRLEAACPRFKPGSEIRKSITGFWTLQEFSDLHLQRVLESSHSLRYQKMRLAGCLENFNYRSFQRALEARPESTTQVGAGRQPKTRVLSLTKRVISDPAPTGYHSQHGVEEGSRTDRQGTSSIGAQHVSR